MNNAVKEEARHKLAVIVGAAERLQYLIEYGDMLQPAQQAAPTGEPSETPWQRYRHGLYTHFVEKHKLDLKDEELDAIEQIMQLHPEIQTLRNELAEWQTAFATVHAPPKVLAHWAIEDAQTLRDLRMRGVIP